jgi:hypothetical protein
VLLRHAQGCGLILCRFLVGPVIQIYCGIYSGGGVLCLGALGRKFQQIML